MASEQEDAVFDHDLDEDDDDESSQSQDDDDDVLEDEDLNSVSPSTSSPPFIIPVALPSAVTIAADPPSVTSDSDSVPDLKRPRAETKLVVVQEKKKPQPLQMDESRRLFQRLWTDEDEIELLQGFLDYTTQRGSNHHDTALFYDQIKSKLQLDFNKNQLVEKLRRLKKKYRNVLTKLSSGKDFNFKSPHDQATFEISCKIWNSTGKIGGVEDGNLEDDHNHHHLFHDGGNDIKIEDQKSTPRSRKRSRSCSASASAVKVEDKQAAAFVTNTDNAVNNNNIINNSSTNSNVNVSSLIEETVRSCLSPLFKELMSNLMAAGPCGGRGIGGLAMNAMPLSFGGAEMVGDEKWRKQQILELEVYSKRLELVQDQIRAQLEELRSMGG